MEYSFPFRNLTFNNFVGFLENRFINHFFIEDKQNKQGYIKGIINGDIERWKGLLSSHENELNQYINSSNQATIDMYFSQVKLDFDYLSEINESFLSAEITKYNTDSQKKFEAEIDKKSKIYFAQEDVGKRLHLERYEITVYDWPMGSFLTSKNSGVKIKEVINYKFYCVEDRCELIEWRHFSAYVDLIFQLIQEYTEMLQKYISKYDSNDIKATLRGFFDEGKIILHVEGSTDEKYIRKASLVLGFEELIDRFVFVDCGGCSEMDKIWNFYTKHAVDVIPTNRVFLYDCDVQKNDLDSGFVKRRVIPKQENNPIKQGIENLFSNDTISKLEKAHPEMIDLKSSTLRIRGMDSSKFEKSINRNEKTNMCNWFFENGVQEDFEGFKVVFEIIKNEVE